MNGPPVWRVSIIFWNETKVDADGNGDPDDPKNVTFEIELALERGETADELAWFSAAALSGATYSADYNKFRNCPVKPKGISRRKAARVHTVGNATDSLSFTFVSLGEPSDSRSFLPAYPCNNEVRA